MAAAIANAILTSVALYALAGVAAALVFQLRATSASFTIGARVLIFPGMVALWPVMLRRWSAAR